MKYPSFIYGSYPSQSPLADAERTVNWYPEQLEAPGATSRIALYPAPGQSAFTTTADVGTRGLFSMGPVTLGVVGTGVYGLASGGTATKYGTVTQDNNQAVLTYNGAAGNTVCIASGGNVYYVDLSSTDVSQVSGVAALQVGMLDGYFIAFDPVGKQIRISPLNDSAGTWDDTQFAQRSIAPDPWQAMVIGNREIWLIGEQTGEVWYDAGSFPFPFAPIPGAFFKYGTPAPFSVTNTGDRIIWLSRSAEGAGIVVQARGYSPQRISTHAVETAITGYARTATITDAEALVYQYAGHIFYVLSFPSANATWVFDTTSSLWHELGTWNSAQGRYDAWHPRVHGYAFGQHLVGERGTGTISILDGTFGTEADGSAIRRLRVAPGLCQEYQQIFYKRLQVFLETGLGTVSGQGANPLMMLRCSDDGGKTWSHERQLSAGAIGQYKTRAIANRLGVSRDRVFEFSVSDPIPWRLMDCFLDVSGARPDLGA